MQDAVTRTTRMAAMAGLAALWCIAPAGARPASQAAIAPVAADVDMGESLRTMAPSVYARLRGQERAQGLLDIVVADENLHALLLRFT